MSELPAHESKEEGAAALPKRIVFFIELPEPLSIAHGSTYAFETDEEVEAFKGMSFFPTDQFDVEPIPLSGYGLVSFRFWQRAVPFPHPVSSTLLDVMATVLPTESSEQASAQMPEDIAGSESQVTVVDAVTYLNDESQPSIGEAYDRVVKKLADLVRAYQYETRRWLLPITRERLPMMVPYSIGDYVNTGDSHRPSVGMLAVHRNVPSSVVMEPLDSESMGRVTTYAGLITKGDPMVAFLERMYHAQYCLSVEGDYMDSVIHAQIAAEVLLDSVLGMLLWEEQVSPIDAAPIFDIGLTGRITRQYHSRIGGKWDPTKRGPVADWITLTYRIRGRVVHGNYHPTVSEARRSLESVRKLQTFVNDRLAASCNKYKRTAICIVGISGLNGRGAWGRKMRDFYENEASSEPDWVVAFATWRDELNSALT